MRGKDTYVRGAICEVKPWIWSLTYYKFVWYHQWPKISKSNASSVFLSLSSFLIFILCLILIFKNSSVQLLSCVWLFVTPWTVTHQASLSITNSRSLLRLMAIESVMPSNHLSSVVPISSCPHSFPASGSFLVSQFFPSGGQSIGVSASESALSMNTQDWFPLGLTGLISLKFKGLSRAFSNTAVQKHQFFCTQLSLWSNSHIHTWPLEKP